MWKEEGWLARLFIIMNLFGLMFVAAALACGQELVVEGQKPTVVYKFEKQGFKLRAEEGGALYRWNLPPDVSTAQAKDKRNVIEVFSATPNKEITISVEYVLIDFDKKVFVERYKEFTFVVGDVKPPTPPDPPKPKPPIPPPDTAPFPSPGLAVLIVYETADRQDGLSDVMSGNKTNDLMSAKGIKGGFLKLDKDSDVSGLPQWVQDARKACQGRPLPVIAISNGKAGFIGAVPKAGDLYSPQATADLIRKFVLE